MQHKINIMAATGRVGRRVVAELLRSGVSPDRLILSARSPSRAAGLGVEAADVRRADYENRASLRSAFRDTRVLLLIPTSADIDRRLAQHENALDAAAGCGVTRIVFSSFEAMSVESRFCHSTFYRRAEASVRRSGLAWTIVRSGLYAEFVAIHARAGLEAAEMRLPVRRGQVAAIGRPDVARGLAAICLGGGHARKVYALTGERAVSLPEIAATAAALAGRRLEFAPCSGDEYARRCRARGVPDAAIQAWRTTWEAVEAGELGRATRHLERLTGRGPSPLDEQLRAILVPEAGDGE